MFDTSQMITGIEGWSGSRTCFLMQPLFQGAQVCLPILFVDFHLLDEFLLCPLTEHVVLLPGLVENLLHVLPLLRQLLQHQGLLGLQQVGGGRADREGRVYH